MQVGNPPAMLDKSPCRHWPNFEQRQIVHHKWVIHFWCNFVPKVLSMFVGIYTNLIRKYHTSRRCRNFKHRCEWKKCTPGDLAEQCILEKLIRKHTKYKKERGTVFHHFFFLVVVDKLVCMTSISFQECHNKRKGMTTQRPLKNTK